MRKRNVAILFRLNKKEAEALDKKVKRSGLNREAYLRQLISGVVPRDAPPPDYYSMMRELHKIGNNLNQIAQKAHVLFREDLLKLNTISKETKLLCHYHIDTAEQLFSLKERLQKQMEQCVEERKHLRYKIRADRPEEEIQEMKEQIKGLTEEIGTLRKEAALCDGIAARSKVIEEKFKMVREEKEKKEEQSHEHIRRSR